jgi:tetratricopeptide (TPR) repeat protein
MNFTVMAQGGGCLKGICCKGVRRKKETKALFFKSFNTAFLPLWLVLFPLFNLYAQPWDDAEAAQRYVQWVQQAINEGRQSEALAALERASDFSDVSSDISYLLAVSRSRMGHDRNSVVEALNKAIGTNRWVNYNENQAFLLKAEQLVAMRSYTRALAALDQIRGGVEITGDAAMLRLLAFRGLATGAGNAADTAQALVRFRSLVLAAMDRFPADPRPLRIFFEYARNRSPVPAGSPAGLPASDIDLLELSFRRLPFLLEADPELTWIAAPLMRDTAAARRFVAAYRAGGISHIQNRDFMPHPGSIPVALNLGLINDIQAAEELFGGSRGINNPLPFETVPDGNPVLESSIIRDTFYLLRSEEGRDFFTQKLLSFSGIIICDNDRDGHFESHTFYSSGVITQFKYDKNQDNVFDLVISFNASGEPARAGFLVTGFSIPALINWEYGLFSHDKRSSYPSVSSVELVNETFLFRPADFQYAPVAFTTLGGSRNFAGLVFPRVSHQYLELTRRTLASFAANVSRPSAEFAGATEQIFLERGIPWQAVEVLNGRLVSIKEFERGFPVLQYVDMDQDGRMETIRRFHRPGHELSWADAEELLDYRALIASSESDWTGDGRFMTGEVYLPDGSVVYKWDMDGSGIMNHTETGNRQ